MSLCTRAKRCSSRCFCRSCVSSGRRGAGWRPSSLQSGGGSTALEPRTKTLAWFGLGLGLGLGLGFGLGLGLGFGLELGKSLALRRSAARGVQRAARLAGLALSSSSMDTAAGRLAAPSLACLASACFRSSLIWLGSGAWG